MSGDDWVGVRGEVEGELDGAVTDATWDWAVERGLVADLLAGKKTIDAVAAALAERVQAGERKEASPKGEAHRQRTQASEMGGGGALLRTPLPGRRPGLRQRRVRALRTDAGASREQQEALARVLALELGSDPDVASFRSGLSRYPLCGDAEVERWVRGRALDELPPTLWLSDVPVRSEYAANLLRAPDWHAVEVVGPYPVDPFSARQTARLHLLPYRLPDTHTIGTAATARSGQLERLRELSERLARAYGWVPADMATFVLTGALPPRAVLATEVERTEDIPALSRIHLTIDPSVSPREVMQTYRALREQVFGARQRDMEPKALEMAVYAARHRHEVGASWQHLLAQWNATNAEAHPDWVYQNQTLFARDCTRARHRLLQTNTGDSVEPSGEAAPADKGADGKIANGKG